MLRLFLPLHMIPLRLYALILGGSGCALAAYFLLRRKPKSAENLERERRAWLDASTFAAIVALVAAIALTASYVPARRAARIDPTEALRAE